ncbi:putative delta-60 repeat protein/predicted secreted protein (Por secretion system target) [Chryseobacterium sp. 52]|uniref:T9SS type A sorting domain-containing protein n=1 Tax=Chryseobacterium sp. 52 TaxID=2035213 RepID=UPI000C19296F|nr:T9SS type A sorting domain-containing protein [Chryseobacterium sp. 52]PIF44606.1 putative delta-60 repeat protein/predicted secreted protein (Por secretion system target) [Chryseobacterium sp. 52]
MIKNLFLVLLLAVQTAFAQIISKDPTFASNGIYDYGNGMYYTWSMAQDSVGRIYSSYSAPNSNESFLIRLTPNGMPDPTFGNNGTIQLPYFTLQNQLKIQTDGKLIIFGYNNTGGIIYRIFPNGQLDPTFGTGGISIIPPISSDINVRSYGLLLQQNGKIIVHGMISGPNNTASHHIYRINTNGSVDTTFGDNGSVVTAGNPVNGTFVLTDNQSNIITISNINDANNLNGIIKKFNSEGQPITSFGNNGTLQMTFNLGYAGAAMIDSNNKIVYSNQNDEIFRINPDGSLDNTFNYNLQAYSGMNGGAWIQSIVEKNGYYYIGGNGEGDFTPTYFISRLNQNGSVDSSFGYYSETSSVYSIEEMTINNNNIVVNGSGFIVKYLLNNTTLSTTDVTKINTGISFENPVKQNLTFSTKEKISKIEIYSGEGKLVKIVKENNSNISGLPKGIYIAKVTFENGKISTKKLIKN